MVDQWNHLSKEEREHYEELSKKDQEARKKAKHSQFDLLNCFFYTDKKGDKRIRNDGKSLLNNESL